MPEHRRRRATKRSATTPIGAKGCGGMAWKRGPEGPRIVDDALRLFAPLLYRVAVARATLGVALARRLLRGTGCTFGIVGVDRAISQA